MGSMQPDSAIPQRAAATRRLLAPPPDRACAHALPQPRLPRHRMPSPEATRRTWRAPPVLGAGWAASPYRPRWAPARRCVLAASMIRCSCPLYLRTSRSLPWMSTTSVSQMYRNGALSRHTSSPSPPAIVATTIGWHSPGTRLPLAPTPPRPPRGGPHTCWREVDVSGPEVPSICPVILYLVFRTPSPPRSDRDVYAPRLAC